MTACRNVRDWMSLALDQPLEPGAQLQLKAHLEACSACRTHWEELQWTHRHLKGLEPVEPPPWMTATIMARVRAEVAPRSSFWRRVLLPLVTNPQLQVASFLLLAATSYYLIRTPSLESEVPRSAESKPEVKAIPAPTAPLAEPTPSRAPASLQKQAAQPTVALKENGLGQLRDQAQGGGALQEKADHAPPPPAPAPRQDSPLSAPPPTALAGQVSANEADAVLALRARKPAPAPELKAEAEEAAPAKAKKATQRDAAKDQPGSAAESRRSEVGPQVIRLLLADPSSARAKVEAAVAKVGGVLLPRQEGESVRSLIARLDSRRLKDLLGLLEQAGRVTERPADPGSQTLPMTITIHW